MEDPKSEENQERRGEIIDIIIMPPKKVISIKLDIELVTLIDKIWREYGYSSRSDFIREAIIYYIQFLTSSRKQKTRMEVSLNLDAELEEGLKEIDKIIL